MKTSLARKLQRHFRKHRNVVEEYEEFIAELQAMLNSEYRSSCGCFGLFGNDVFFKKKTGYLSERVYPSGKKTIEFSAELDPIVKKDMSENEECFIKMLLQNFVVFDAEPKFAPDSDSVDVIRSDSYGFIGRIDGSLSWEYCTELLEEILKENTFNYYDPEFRKKRLEVFLRDGEVCACCGTTPKPGTSLTIDHIKPVSKYPELANGIDNLQVLCWECNQSKSNKHNTDYRGK